MKLADASGLARASLVRKGQSRKIILSRYSGPFPRVRPQNAIESNDLQEMLA